MLKPSWKPSSKWISLVIFLLLVSSSVEGGRLRTYVDKNGVLHITDFWKKGSSSREPQPGPTLERLIEETAREHGVDPKLVKALIQVESAFDQRALSRRGAMGLMQLMPETARDYRISNPWDIRENVKGGTAYLRDLLYQFGGDLEKALAAYNAGPSAVKEYGGIPPFPETREYVKKVLSLYPIKGNQGFLSGKENAKGKRHHPRPYRPIKRIRLPDGSVLYTNLP